MEIQIAVINKIPAVIGDIKCIVADNSDYTVRFSFDDQWDDDAKTVYFVLDNGFAYPPVAMTDDTVEIPRQTNGGINRRVYIGVSQGDVKTTQGIGLRVLSSITDMIDDSAVQPEPSLWEDIVSRVENLEQNGGGGGSSGIPIDTASVGQTIRVTAVDGNGKPTAWEAADYQPRTHWQDDGTWAEILPETVPELLDDDGDGTGDWMFIPTDITLTAGQDYRVIWNGVPFDLTAIDGGDGAVVISDLNAKGDPQTFAVGWYPGFGGLLATSVDGSTDVTVSISTGNTGELHRLNNKYLDLHWLPTASEVLLTSEEVVGTGGMTPPALYGSGAIHDNIGAYGEGAELRVVIDGESYNLTLHGSGDDGWFGVVDPVYSNGELVSFKATVAYGGTYTRVVFPDTDTHWVEIYGYNYNAIPPGFARKLQFLKTPLMSFVPGQFIKISGGDGTVLAEDTDKTLSNDGGIADAKVTGDKLKEISDKISSGTDISLGMTGAAVGQIARITAVDENGMPTAWEPADVASGGEKWRLIRRITLEEDVASIDGFSLDDDGNEFDLRGVRLVSPNIASSVYVTNDMHGRLHVATKGGTSNASVFATNIFIEISMVQNPSNYPFFAQVVNLGGIWRIDTSSGTNGRMNPAYQLARSETIQKIGLATNNSNNFIYAAGTIFEFWGLDA